MNPALMNRRGFVPQGYQVAPALSPNAQSQPGALSGNARGSVKMPMYPQNQKIGLGEAMMRIGTSGLGQSATGGGLGVYNAMGQTYGDIMDYNRARDMEEYAVREAQALEQQRRLDLQRKLEREQTPETDREAVSDLRVGIAKLAEAKKELEANKNLTGVGVKDLISRAIGKTIGDDAEAVRLFLEEIRLDSIMRRVAETKGAISNAEMALFGKQAPTMNAQENVWIAWIDRQMQMSQILLNRLASGERVDENAPIGETMPGINFPAPANTAPTNDDDQYIIEEVTPTNK